MKYTLTAILSLASIIVTLIIPSTVSAYYNSSLWELERQTEKLVYNNNAMRSCNTSINAHWDFTYNRCDCDDEYDQFYQSGSNQYSSTVCVGKEDTFYTKVTDISSNFITFKIGNELLAGNIAPINQTGGVISGCQSIFMSKNKYEFLSLYRSKFFFTTPVIGYCEITNTIIVNDHIPEMKTKMRSEILKANRGAKTVSEKIARLEKLKEKYNQELLNLPPDTIALEILRIKTKITSLSNEIRIIGGGQ